MSVLTIKRQKKVYCIHAELKKFNFETEKKAALFCHLVKQNYKKPFFFFFSNIISV